MKPLMQATWVFLLLLTGSSYGQDEMKPAEVSLCDLYQHAEQYAGKMVKVRGGSVGDLSLANILHDSPAESCPAYMRLIVAFPDQVKPAPVFQLIKDESYKKLQEALHYSSPIHIDATYEGRFDPLFVWRDHKRVRVSQDDQKGYGKKHEYDGRIVLHQVSDVWSMPLPRK